LFIDFELGLGALKPMKPGIDVPFISMHEPRSVLYGIGIGFVAGGMGGWRCIN